MKLASRPLAAGAALLAVTALSGTPAEARTTPTRVHGPPAAPGPDVPEQVPTSPATVRTVPLTGARTVARTGAATPPVAGGDTATTAGDGSGRGRPRRSAATTAVGGSCCDGS